ncbi:MAG: DUF4157 domain-containing protein, partial [Chloroflexi bacterium]|nr:DUF4157 domain-containing protein [Chloroflexota bacterium]
MTDNFSVEVADRWESLAEELRRRLGPGIGLDSVDRSSFEAALGQDLSGAVVHRGPLAGALAAEHDADALTSEQHILGSAEQLDATTRRGRALLGHELTHVVRGRGGYVAATSPNPPIQRSGTDDEYAARIV